MRERAGVSSELFEVPAQISLGEISELLIEHRPALASLLGSVKIAVNEEFVGDDFVLHDGDEVALIPPVSGGA